MCTPAKKQSQHIELKPAKRTTYHLTMFELESFVNWRYDLHNSSFNLFEIIPEEEALRDSVLEFNVKKGEQDSLVDPEKLEEWLNGKRSFRTGNLLDCFADEGIIPEGTYYIETY